MLFRSVSSGIKPPSEAKRSEAKALAAVGDNPGRLSSGIGSIDSCAGGGRFQRCLFIHPTGESVVVREASLGKERNLIKEKGAVYP